MDFCSARRGIIATATKANNQEYRDNEEEEDFEDEVTIQPELLYAVLKRAMENNKYDCRLELSTECTNAIKTSGESKETVRECAKWIRAIRNDLMKSCWKPLEETRTIGTNSVELITQKYKYTQEDEILQMKEQKSHHNGKEIEKMLISGHPKVINWLDEVEKRQENSSKEVAKSSAIANKEDYGIKKKRDISVGRKMLKVYFENGSFNKKTSFQGRGKWAKTKVPAKMMPLIVGKDGKALNKIHTEFPSVAIYLPPPPSSKREVNGKATPANNIDLCGDDQHSNGNGPDDMLVITYRGVPHEVSSFI
jgi:hypothetical protein